MLIYLNLCITISCIFAAWTKLYLLSWLALFFRKISGAEKTKDTKTELSTLATATKSHNILQKNIKKVAVSE